MRQPSSYYRRRFALVLAAIVVFTGLPIHLLAQEAETDCWIGMRAPEFRLNGTDGKTHSLGAMLSEGPVVVLWFPKAYTGNTEIMLKSADAAAKSMSENGVTVVAATCDKTKYLTPFANELGIDLNLLSDPTRTTAIQWGAVGAGREIPHRRAYFIGRDGRFAAIRSDLDASNTGSKIIEESKRLGWLD